MQALKAEVVIQVPNDKVLIDKVEYKELKKEREIGLTWSLRDLKRELNIRKNPTWITEMVLKPHRKEIEDWCIFKEGVGGKNGYRIQPSKAREWFEKNWRLIDWNESLPQKK